MSLELTQKILENYQVEAPYNKRVAYLSMEFAIDQSLKIYAGGLGYLAGSHMRSAYELKQNIVGIGMLWHHGYYEQIRDAEGNIQIGTVSQDLSSLIDTGIVFKVTVANHPVSVKAWLLPPDVFQTAPVFLLSTYIPENDYLSHTITERLYAPNDLARIAASIVLGQGAYKLLQILNMEPEIWHLNESHGLPLLFSLYQKHRSWAEVQKRAVFTTHTPELAGNEIRPMQQLWDMSFFGEINSEELYNVSSIHHGNFNYTETAFKIVKKENAVSKLHAKVCSENLYVHLKHELNLISITNAQNRNYWQDPILRKAFDHDNDLALESRKNELKTELFKVVKQQTGKTFNPHILTLVWARRFAGYKRAWLLLKDLQRFHQLITNSELPIQIIWAGKPYPFASKDQELFQWLVKETHDLQNCAVLTGYELELSAKLKRGSDIWLNTPRYLHEASGTSGMSAAMNCSINLSVDDGWVPEFARHGENAFVIPHADPQLSEEERDEKEYQTMMDLLQNVVLPMYYHDRTQWWEIAKTAMKEIVKEFDSSRMAREYYDKMYNS